MQSQQQAQTRPDSPTDNNLNFHLKSQSHNQESLFGHNSQQNTTQNMYNTIHMPTDYPSDNDVQKPQQAKMNSFGAGPFKTSASFTSLPNSNRSRHHTASLGGGPYRDGSVALSHPYGPTSETFTPGAISHMTSAQSQPQLNSGHAFEALHQGRFDFSGSSQPPNGDRKQSYGIVDFGGGPSTTLLQSHPVSAGKTVGVPLSLHAQHQQQQQHPGFGHHSGSQNAFSSIHIQSQTPYGPHLQTNGLVTGTGVAANAVGVNHVNGIPSVNPSQEEISTIFVVGFPEDMQEREFQNMFTFCPGFEAATLKIPNKEYTAYGNAAGPVPPGSIRPGPNGMGNNYSQSFAGINDPYNLVTVNQGGVVVDGGRDGPLASWPATVPGMSQDDGGHFGPGGGSMQSMPPRKQIIGFAKFRSRSEALEARDVLQGRRVDIEKGAVLKAEMAKKNLHTKRGVGPLPLQLPGVINNPGGNIGPPDPMALGSALNVTMNNMANMGLSSTSSMESLSARDRELAALGAMGLGSVNQWREASSRLAETEEERERRRDREVEAINAMGLGSGARGPRERAEEDERERERRRKEKEARLRSTNLTAFDAFHSVPSQTISRHPSNSFLSRTVSIDNGVVSNSLLANGSGMQVLAQPNVTTQDDRFNGNLPGPWDTVNLNGLRKINISAPPNPPIRPPSSSRQSPHSSRDPSFPSPLPTATDLPSLQQPPFRNDQYSPSCELPDKQQYMIHNHGVTSSQPSSRASSIVDDSQHSDADGEVEGTPLAVSTSQGESSPQLPSPVSGASSTSTRNLVDQNPPINTLYVGNLPTSPVPAGYPLNYLEESLRELFQRRPGFRKLCFRQKSNGPMCFVEFEDVNYATKSLNDLYGNTLGGLIKGGGIRLSYSKNPLGVRTPTSASSSGSSSQQQQPPQNASQPANGGPYSFEGYTPRSSVDVGAVLRRDSTVTSPPPSSNYTFMSSPPPRFFSPTVSSSAFGNSLQLSNNVSSFPRTNNNLHGFVQQHNNNTSVSTFSPFGISTPQHATIVDQTNSDTHEHHFSHNALSPSTNNIEAARAG